MAKKGQSKPAKGKKEWPGGLQKAVQKGKTYSAKPGDVERNWVLIDAEGRVLGRLACEIAKRLRGKHRPTFTPHVDTGEFVVIVNAAKVRVTGKKLKDKLYYRHSGYPGGIRSLSLEQVLKRHPVRVIEHAVRGMLPKGPLGRALYRKLKVYAGPEHKHEAQKPVAVGF